MEIAGKLIGHDIDHNALLNKMMEKDPKNVAVSRVCFTTFRTYG